MPTLAEILALLTGPKVWDGTTWHTLDAHGAYLPDPANVLHAGVHGALLYAANEAAAQLGADTFNYLQHIHLGRYVGDPAIGRMAQRLHLARRR